MTEEPSKYIQFLAWVKVASYTLAGVFALLLALLVGVMVG